MPGYSGISSTTFISNIHVRFFFHFRQWLWKLLIQISCSSVPFQSRNSAVKYQFLVIPDVYLFTTRYTPGVMALTDKG